MPDGTGPLLTAAGCGRWLCALGLLCSIRICAADEAQSAPAKFSQADRDENQQLSREELFSGISPSPVQQRDFLLADFDGNGELSLSEYRGFINEAERSQVPDPLEDLLEVAMVALDESCGDWSKQPDLHLPAQLLLNGFLTSFSPSKSSVYDPKLLPILDPDGNQQVSRDEARRFLKIQLGLLDPAGREFRDSTGWLVSARQFTSKDTNGDGQLDETEFEDLIKAIGAKAEFNTVDRDRDKSISPDEFVLSGLTERIDVIEWFRQADTNLDAKLNREELQAASTGRSRFLALLSFRSFDADNDLQLSLHEYLLTPHCSGLQWKFDAVDRNYDQSLSFAEFRMQPFDPLILRSFYFSRFDRNRDGKLTRNEFSFATTPTVLERFVLESGELSIQLQDPDYAQIDRVNISPATGRVAIQVLTVDELEPAIVVMNLDGTDRELLCSGEHPSWSPDGRRLCFARSFDGNAIQILDLESRKETRIGSGSSPAWSPDGKWIVFLDQNKLVRYSTMTGESVTLPHVPAGSSHWGDHIVWHPDSQQIILKEVGVAQWALTSLTTEADPPTKTRLVTNTFNLGDDIAWAPDGSHFIFPMYSPELRRISLFQFAPGSGTAPQPVERYSSSSRIISCCYAPDGKSLLIAVDEKNPNVGVTNPQPLALPAIREN